MRSLSATSKMASTNEDTKILMDRETRLLKPVRDINDRAENCCFHTNITTIHCESYKVNNLIPKIGGRFTEMTSKNIY